jgi:subtilisin
MKLHPRFSIFLVFVLLVTSVLTAGAQAAPAAQPYIIVFNDTVDVPAAAQALERAHGLQTGFIYEHALKGMSAMVPAGRLIALQKDPRVKYVVEDMERSISAQTVPTGIQRIFADTGNGNLDIDARMTTASM